MNSKTNRGKVSEVVVGGKSMCGQGIHTDGKEEDFRMELKLKKKEFRKEIVGSRVTRVETHCSNYTRFSTRKE